MPNSSPRPIEPGCLCLIIHSQPPEYIGRQCTAVRTLTPGELIQITDLGLATVSQPCWIISIPNEPQQCVALESQLRRIDGHQPEPNKLTETIPSLARARNPRSLPNA